MAASATSLSDPANPDIRFNTAPSEGPLTDPARAAERVPVATVPADQFGGPEVSRDDLRQVARAFAEAELRNQTFTNREQGWPVRIGEETRVAKLVMKERADGTFFYDHALSQALNEEGPVAGSHIGPAFKAGDSASGTGPTTDIGTMLAAVKAQNDPVRWRYSARQARAADAREAVTAGPAGAAVKRLIEAGQVQFHDEAPAGAPLHVSGWTDKADGSLHLLNRVPPERAQEVLLHEAFHGRVQPLIGEQAWSGLMGELSALARRAARDDGALGQAWTAAMERVQAARRQGEHSRHLAAIFREFTPVYQTAMDQHLHDALAVRGMISVKQAKTGAELMIPVHPELAKVLAAWPQRHAVVLVTVFGKPFTANGYGNWFRDAIKDSGLPGMCSSHGLRKAAARRLAEAGCTEKQIAAITGHTTLKEVARYTKAANQAKLARAALNLQLLAANEAIPNPVGTAPNPASAAA